MGDDQDPYVPRFVDALLDELLAELDAVMITGPRACGKTTTAARRVRTMVRLDDPRQATTFAAAADAALAAAEPPVLLDEWQEVPDVLGAVKRAVDTRRGPGRFLLTGSVRARMSNDVWAGTGRVTPLEMAGLTVAEQRGCTEGAVFLDRLFDPSMRPPLLVSEAPDVTDYVELALAGGFPDALGLGSRARAAWFTGYVDQLVHRDAVQVGAIRVPERLMATLRAVVACTAGTPADTTLAEAAGVDVRTVRGYLDLLEDLRVIVRLPAWHSNRLSRLVKSPKLHVADPGIAAAVLGVDARGALLDGHVLGQLLETFVVAQLRPLLQLGTHPVSMSHLRDRGGEHEIDIVLENPRGEVVAIEVKAAARAGARDVRHLEWLRDRLGERFVRGVVLTTGSVGRELSDRVLELPIATAWTSGAWQS